MRRGAVVLAPEQRWECPGCGVTDVTHKLPRPGESITHFHRCRSFGGLKTPMVAAGVRAELRVVERGDYVGDAQGLRYVDGRPVMAVRTVRDDGEDCAVFAPVAAAAVSGVSGGSR